MTERSLESFCHRQNRLDLWNINILSIETDLDGKKNRQLSNTILLHPVFLMLNFTPSFLTPLLPPYLKGCKQMVNEVYRQSITIYFCHSLFLTFFLLQHGHLHGLQPFRMSLLQHRLQFLQEIAKCFSMRSSMSSNVVFCFNMVLSMCCREIYTPLWALPWAECKSLLCCLECLFSSDQCLL